MARTVDYVAVDAQALSSLGPIPRSPMQRRLFALALGLRALRSAS